ncbi:MAG TPA: PilZ domain-containing protein [Phycisphaerae bacterium]|nr:PilZ domain-containing protein [Phycisphaerae bacterium]
MDARDNRNGHLVNPATKSITDPAAERRRDQRLEIGLPVEFRHAREDGDVIVRTLTRNISSGGLYLELDRSDFQPGDRVEAELSIPAAEGVSPYPGRATVQLEILRVTPLDDRRGAAHSHYGLAARFLEPLRFSY